ncbi:monovalent cation/H+ antiporter complex subunit F [Streptomyces sp. SM11]|uniref:monovalent cation/H+ antiporter complex subunit F n=1 Tax=Streptomyces sp. SM11 TaxID=565557 RepID=UPI000CD5A867|nr:monovalent cation/H+ antiporter complex subunit F [Streptomyces sp. SM11]
MTAPEHVDRILLTTAVVLILVAGGLLLARIWRGPSMLDRAISLDVCAALIIAGLGAKSAFTRDPFYFSIMLVLAFLGFTGSVGIARFIAVRDRPRTSRSPNPDATQEGPR